MHVTIIAEIGVNHNGDIDLAKRMIHEAANAGVDIVKFQTAKPELVISKFAPKAEYQENTTGRNESQLEMCKKIHLPFKAYIELKKECEAYGVKFLSTPFDLESIIFLDQLGMDIWKIPSGEITNLPYLIAIAKTKKPVIMSTGMCTITEIYDAVNILKKEGTSEISLLHCTTEYPAPFKDINLNVIRSMKKEFHLPVGYSDHTAGIEASIAAVALGAEIIEKHFTLDKNMKGPDHKASIEPSELKELVKSIRNIQIALGDGIKKVSESEEKNINIARKSIVAKSKIRKGDIYSVDNITTKRPGNGISPMRWHEILGMKALRDYEEDELIEI